jgi:CBS-domain-containing membrane protein
MSPRAAWRLEALGFEQVHDYVGGKADWLANGLPRAGKTATVPYAGELVDRDPPTCKLADTVTDVAAMLEASHYGFCLALNDQRILLGRVRRSTLARAEPRATAASVMEPGLSTVRFNTPARELVQRLAERELTTAIVTTPGGCLVGVFHRADAQRRLQELAPR